MEAYVQVSEELVVTQLKLMHQSTKHNHARRESRALSPLLKRCMIGTVVVDTDGAHTRFAGIPGFTYIIERSTDGADWTAIGSAVVPANGLFEFLDSAPPSGSVFYRTTAP